MIATKIVLPEGIRFSVDGDGVPVGSLITDPGVARVCLRCKHEECPCCNDWCDSCFRDTEDHPETDHNQGCATELQCKYDRERHPLMLTIHEVHSEVFANVGGGFGVTDDGRVWFRGRTSEEVRRDERERFDRAQHRMRKTIRDRQSQVRLWEEQFRALSHHERAAYLAGMRHMRTLMEWHGSDAQASGLRTSVKVTEALIVKMDDDVTHMERLK